MKNKKFYGYFSLFAILFFFANNVAGNSSLEKIDQIEKNETTNTKKKNEIFPTTNSNRIYFVDGKARTVDVSKNGWAVDILLKDF